MSDTTTPKPVEPAAPEGVEESQEGTAKTFTQDDLDRIVAERLAREQRKYADYEDAKAKAARLEELEAENASDSEKAVAAARKEVEQELTARFAKERVADKIEVAAAGRFADVEDARLRLGSRVDDFVGADGSVDADAIATALDEVLEKNPHLAAKAPEPEKPASPSAAGIGTRGTAQVDTSPGYDRLRAAYGE